MRVLHQNECYAEHNQRDGNRLVIVEQFFKQVVPLETDDRRRNARYQNFDPQLDGIRIQHDGCAAVTALSPFKRENLSPEQDNDREYRTELNNHLEHAVKRFRHVQFDELVEQDHMSGTADRQPLGDASTMPNRNALSNSITGFSSLKFLFRFFLCYFIPYHNLCHPASKQAEMS